MNYYRLKYGPELLVAFLVILLQGSIAVAVDLPPSTNPPGGLAPSNTPQIVLLTFDDSVTIDSLSLVQQALTNHFNPNGDSIKATFFVSMDARYDPYSIRQLYDAGHEIALHTMSHETGSSSSLFRWWQEIASEKRTLSELCGIPLDEITGFRAPYLAPNDSTFRVLSERQFRYDSNFPESLSGLSTTPSNMIWPYTLDHGLMQNAQPAYSPTTNYPGLFEIPLWVQFTNMTEVTTMDPPDTFSSNAVVELWKTNFLEHYNGNRAPYGIYLHATSTNQWLSNPTHSAWRIAALREFIDWALTQPDTWFVTCNDLVDYMIEPVSAQDAIAHPAFQTPVRTPFPTSEVTRCSIAGTHIFYACGPCPLIAPHYTNATLKLFPTDDRSLTLNVVSQSVNTAWCVMVISNETPHEVYDWAISFTLGGGNMLSLFDATWTQSVDQVSAIARSHNRTLSPFDAHVINFRVERTGGNVTFDQASMAMIELGGAIPTDGSTANDFDGDGKSDLAVFDQNSGRWFIRAVDGTQIGWSIYWGWPGVETVPGDYDGDGKDDLAVFDQNSGRWFVKSLEGGTIVWEKYWGWPGVRPVSGDYDGDEVDDLAVFDPTTGRWFIKRNDNQVISWSLNWGWPGVEAVSGDYNGDGTDDLAVFDQNSGRWFIRSVGGTVIGWSIYWGWPGVETVPGDYDGDGKDDLAVFDQNSGRWFIRSVAGDIIGWSINWGWPGVEPVSGDFDGDGMDDLAVFDQNTGRWFIRSVAGDIIGWNEYWGWSGVQPIGR